MSSGPLLQVEKWDLVITELITAKRPFPVSLGKVLAIVSEPVPSEFDSLSHKATSRNEISFTYDPWSCLHCTSGKGLKQEGS